MRGNKIKISSNYRSMVLLNNEMLCRLYVEFRVKVYRVYGEVLGLERFLYVYKSLFYKGLLFMFLWLKIM